MHRGYGIGAVVSQGGRPISFFSQALLAKAEEKSVYKKVDGHSVDSVEVVPLTLVNSLSGS